MKTGYGLILLAGTAWGSVGILAHFLFESGFSLLEVSWFKEVVCFMFLLPFVIGQEHGFPLIRATDIKRFLGFALVESVLYNLFYFGAIKLVGASLAVVLIYTAPAFSVLIGNLAFDEEISKGKIIAVVLCFTGAFLALGGYSLTDVSLNKKGLLLGLAAGLSYAVYGFCSKWAGRRYSAAVVSLYGNGFGVLCLTALRLWQGFAPRTLSTHQIGLLIAVGVWGSLVPWLSYSRGIKSVEMSKAPIVASVELVVGVALAWLLLGERLNAIQVIGVILILVTAGLVQLTDFKTDDVIWKEGRPL